MKARYRYNWKTQEWGQVYRINTNVYFITGQRKPDGSLVTFDLPFDSPMVDVCRRMYASNS